VEDSLARVLEPAPPGSTRPARVTFAQALAAPDRPLKYNLSQPVLPGLALRDITCEDRLDVKFVAAGSLLLKKR